MERVNRYGRRGACPKVQAGRDRALLRAIERLAANANCAETENDVAAGNLPAKTAHGLKSREQQHLVNLVLHFKSARPGKNLITNHLALSVHGNIEHQAVRKGELGLVILGRPIAGGVRKSDEFCGLHQIQWNVVRNGLNGDTRRHQLEHEDEYENGRHKAPGCGKRKRTENIVEKNFGAIADTLPAAMPILRLLGLRRGDFDAHGKIRRGERTGRTGKQNGKLAITLQLLAAVRTNFKMFAHFATLGGPRRTFNDVIKIPCQLGSNGRALHGISSFAGTESAPESKERGARFIRSFAKAGANVPAEKPFCPTSAGLKWDGSALLAVEWGAC